MFLVGNDAAEAIRTAYLDKGEVAALIEFRRFFRVDDDTSALRAVKTIASWNTASTAPPPPTVPKRRPSRQAKRQPGDSGQP